MLLNNAFTLEEMMEVLQGSHIGNWMLGLVHCAIRETICLLSKVSNANNTILETEIKRKAQTGAVDILPHCYPTQLSLGRQ